MKLSSRKQLLKEATEVLKKLKRENLQEQVSKPAFPSAVRTFNQYSVAAQKLSDLEQRVENLKSKIESEFAAAARKYMTGKWDIILYPGESRWQRGRKNSKSGDKSNWYNAEIKEMEISEFKVNEFGEPMVLVRIRAYGDNIEGEDYRDLENIQIYKAYESQEGKQFRDGYYK